MEKLITYGKKIALLSAVSLTLGIAHVDVSKASLVYDSTWGDTGQGFGAKEYILSMQKTGGAGTASDIEEGSVAWDGAADLLTGPYTLNEVQKTATWSFGYLGITDASELLFVFNPSEVGSPSGRIIWVEDVVVSIYAPDGTPVWDSGHWAVGTHEEHYVTDGPGLGSGDFVYKLDLAQTASLNAYLSGLSGFSDYRIGLYAKHSYADDGPNGWLVGRGAGNPIPEPTTLLLFGTGLAGLAAVGRRR